MMDSMLCKDCGHDGDNCTCADAEEPEFHDCRWFYRYHAAMRACADLDWQADHHRRRADRWQALAVARREQARRLQEEITR